MLGSGLSRDRDVVAGSSKVGPSSADVAPMETVTTVWALCFGGRRQRDGRIGANKVSHKLASRFLQCDGRHVAHRRSQMMRPGLDVAASAAAAAGRVTKLWVDGRRKGSSEGDGSSGGGRVSWWRRKWLANERRRRVERVKRSRSVARERLSISKCSSQRETKAGLVAEAGWVLPVHLLGGNLEGGSPRFQGGPGTSWRAMTQLPGPTGACN